MVKSSSTTSLTISTVAASLFYIYYYTKKLYTRKGSLDKHIKSKDKNQKESADYDNNNNADDNLHIDIDNQQSSDSDISFENPAAPFFGLNWSNTRDQQEDDDISFSLLAHNNSSNRNRNRNRNSNSNSNSNKQTHGTTTTAPQTQKEHSCIYLDYNGTTPIDQRVVAAMIPYFTTHFGNPSSSHYYGAAPKQAIENARKSILKLLHPNHISKTRLTEERDGIIFTGCGTEADNLAIHAAIQCHAKYHSSKSADCGNNVNDNVKTNANDDENNKSKHQYHIVTSNVEHPAIAQYLKALEKEGKIEVTYVPVNSEGCVEVEEMIKAIRPGETILVTLMLANNESGALQPVKEVAQYCRAHNILFHTDAAQAVGKVSIALDETGIGACVDMITIVGHKFGAPKGIACLYVRPGCLGEGDRCELDSSDYLLLGGGQEKGKRAGTENVVSAINTEIGMCVCVLCSTVCVHLCIYVFIYTFRCTHEMWARNSISYRC